MTWRRWLKRARRRTWHAVRGHYMLGVTAVILALAAAGGSGAFSDETSHREAARRESPAAPAPDNLAISYPDAVIAGPVLPTLIMTYYIVGSEDQRNSMNALKDTLINREWLRRNAFEVVLINSPEDEPRAFAFIEERRRMSSAAQFIVEDMRTPKP